MREDVTSMTAELDDRDLLQAYVAGDRATFDVLVGRHAGGVFAVCRRRLDSAHDAEDALQVVFLLLMKRSGDLLRGIQAGRSLAPWLHRVAVDVSCNMLRERGRRRRRETEWWRRRYQESAPAEAVTAAAEQDRHLALLDQALEELPERYREALVLHHLQGYSIQDVAAALGRSEGAVKMALLRGRHRLHRLLERRGVQLSAAVLLSLSPGPAPAADVSLRLAQPACRLIAQTTADLPPRLEATLRKADAMLRYRSLARTCKPLVVGVYLLFAAAGAWSMAGAAENGSDQPYIGHRNDGTGVFPADCQPVSRWNEYDFVEEEYTDDKGKRRKRDVPGSENHINIVWKKPLPMHCNGGMIVAGGKLLLMADRGGYGYAFDQVPEFLGELLICLDPATGKELWRRDVHHLDLLPPAEATSLAQDIKAAHELYVNCYPAFLAYRQVAAPFLGGGHGVEAIEHPTSADEQRYAEAARAFHTWWPEVPKSIAELKGFFAQKGNDDSIILHNYTQCQFGNFMKHYRRDENERRSRCNKAGYGWGAWYGVQSFVGNAMPTPVSDGQHVWVWTAHNDVACYDLDGKQMWVRYYGGNGSGNNVQHYVFSPFLADGKLIMRAKIDGGKGKGFEWVALDTRSGEIVWRRPAGGNQNYTGTPFLFDLPAGDGDEVVSFFWTHFGEAIRVADGKLLGEGLGSHSYGHSTDSNRPAAALPEQGIVFLNNVPMGKENDLPTKGTLALRLKATSRDQVAGELLWSKEDQKQRLFRMVAKGEHVYGFTGDAKKGKGQMAAVKSADGKEVARFDAQIIPWHLSSFAGNKIFGMGDDGFCTVVDLADGSTNVNRLGDRAYSKDHERRYFNEGAQPFFSGNRIFIRSYTDVYCIGDPREETRLSAAHR